MARTIHAEQKIHRAFCGTFFKDTVEPLIAEFCAAPDAEFDRFVNVVFRLLNSRG